MTLERDSSYPLALRPWGSWNYLQDRRRGVVSASFMCPGCGLFATLTDHEVAKDGTVSPSVDCPKCDFHEMITLEGWNPKEVFDGA